MRTLSRPSGTAVPVSENGQVIPAPDTFPLALRSAVRPLSLPSAEPSSPRPPPQVALKVPEAYVSLIAVIFHSRLPHEPTLRPAGAAVAADVQLPVARILATSEGDVGPSCLVSTHAAATTARATATVIANVRMRIMCLLPGLSCSTSH